MTDKDELLFETLVCLTFIAYTLYTVATLF